MSRLLGVDSIETRRYRLFFPLQGLMVSRYLGDDAFTNSLLGEDFHLHDSQVVMKDLMTFMLPVPREDPVWGNRIAPGPQRK